MNEKLRAAIYGFAVGDALGVPYEFKQRDTFKCYGMTGYGTWNQPKGTWSDDTSMMLATCDSIRELGKIVPEDIMKRFTMWYYEGKYNAHGKPFDIGATTAKALVNYRYFNIEPLKCGSKDERSQGNGSLMRILPLAFVEGITNEDIKNVSKLTHAHPECLRVCIDYVKVAKMLIKNANDEVLSSFSFVGRNEIKSTGYVWDSFKAALWCVGTALNYSEAVLKAVNLGGDTDTIAALTGGLAGIKYGYKAIPKPWIKQLANKELIEKCLF